MTLIRNRLIEIAPSLITNLKANGFGYVDNFLGIDTCLAMRKEAEEFYNDGHYSISQSTRFDANTNRVISYDKHNVYSMELDGKLYNNSPRLHEYVVSMVSNIVPILNDNFKDLSLITQQAANKLAVCTGNGSHYAKHFDKYVYILKTSFIIIIIIIIKYG
jgi:hypothetical protein